MQANELPAIEKHLKRYDGPDMAAVLCGSMVLQILDSEQSTAVCEGAPCQRHLITS